MYKNFIKLQNDSKTRGNLVKIFKWKPNIEVTKYSFPIVSDYKARINLYNLAADTGRVNSQVQLHLDLVFVSTCEW